MSLSRRHGRVAEAALCVVGISTASVLIGADAGMFLLHVGAQLALNSVLVFTGLGLLLRRA